MTTTDSSMMEFKYLFLYLEKKNSACIEKKFGAEK